LLGTTETPNPNPTLYYMMPMDDEWCKWFAPSLWKDGGPVSTTSLPVKWSGVTVSAPLE